MKLEINYLQEENWKTNKTCGEKKQHVTKQRIAQRRNQIKKYLATNENRTQLSKIYGIQKKQLKGAFIVIHTYLNKQEKCQISNLNL